MLSLSPLSFSLSLSLSLSLSPSLSLPLSSLSLSPLSLSLSFSLSIYLSFVPYVAPSLVAFISVKRLFIAQHGGRKERFIIEGFWQR